MYAREQRLLLRHYLERGLSKAEIARKLGGRAAGRLSLSIQPDCLPRRRGQPQLRFNA